MGRALSESRHRDAVPFPSHIRVIFRNPARPAGPSCRSVERDALTVRVSCLRVSIRVSIRVTQAKSLRVRLICKCLESGFDLGPGLGPDEPLTPGTGWGAGASLLPSRGALAPQPGSRGARAPGTGRPVRDGGQGLPSGPLIGSCGRGTAAKHWPAARAEASACSASTSSGGPRYRVLSHAAKTLQKRCKNSRISRKIREPKDPRLCRTLSKKALPLRKAFFESARIRRFDSRHARVARGPLRGPVHIGRRPRIAHPATPHREACCVFAHVDGTMARCVACAP